MEELARAEMVSEQLELERKLDRLQEAQRTFETQDGWLTKFGTGIVSFCSGLGLVAEASVVDPLLWLGQKVSNRFS